ncbi:hypothetical protein [uncultured Erythrobacter sp.]|uniref:hypothetical protein n=1 Tax=uncultured Erythrobacter sp. TaxID=263913 RepID=UPI002634FEB6|nr:hypothetical protein [uncultured Erythrobacter sp.]
MSNQSGKEAFVKAADLLATVGGVISAFVATPMLYSATIDAAYDFTYVNYGADWDWLAPILCGLGSLVISFAACQIILSLTLRLGFAKLAEIIFG